MLYLPGPYCLSIYLSTNQLTKLTWAQVAYDYWLAFWVARQVTLQYVWFGEFCARAAGSYMCF